MQLLSIGNLYVSHEKEKFYAISIHFRNYLLEWEGNAKCNCGTIQDDNRSGDEQTSKSDGAI